MSSTSAAAGDPNETRTSSQGGIRTSTYSQGEAVTASQAATSSQGAGLYSYEDSDGVIQGAGSEYTSSSMLSGMTSRSTGSTDVSGTTIGYSTGLSTYRGSATSRTAIGTDLGVTSSVTTSSSSYSSSVSTTGTSTYSAPISTATTSWASSVTTGARGVETSTTITETAEKITATRVTTTAGTVTGSYWTTQYTEATVTRTTATVITSAATTLVAQTTTYDPRSQHVDTVISRTSPSEWLFFHTGLAASGNLSALAPAFDITTSSARADATGTLTLRLVTDTSTATRTTTGYANAATTITRSTLSNVTTTSAQWTGGFPMSTATALRALVTSTTGTSNAPVATSGTITFAPAGNLDTITVTVAYSPLTTRPAYMHAADGGSATFPEHVAIASTYTRESYQAIPGSSATVLSSTGSTSTTSFNLSTSAGFSQGWTSLTTANSRYGATSAITPDCTPYGTIARGNGWQAGISAGPFDAMGTAITATRAAFFGNIVAAFANASPTCLQEQENYSSSSTVTSGTSVSATVGTNGAWHVTTANSSTSEAFILSVGLAGAGDQFEIGSAASLGVGGASFTGVAAGHPRFSGESTLVSFAPGAYRATGINSAGVSGAGASTVGYGGATSAYTSTAVAVEPGPLLITNTLTVVTTGNKDRLFASTFDPES